MAIFIAELAYFYLFSAECVRLALFFTLIGRVKRAALSSSLMPTGCQTHLLFDRKRSLGQLSKEGATNGPALVGFEA